MVFDGRKQFFLVSFICFSHKLHNHRYLNTEEIHSIQKKQNLKKQVDSKVARQDIA